MNPQAAPSMTNLTPEAKECVDRCLECARVCTETVAHCLEEGGIHAEREHISLLHLCADMCTITARALVLLRDHHERFCNLCAEIAEVCEKNCDSYTGDHPMKMCAKVCHDCAQACHDVVQTSQKQTQVQFQQRDSRPN